MKNKMEWLSKRKKKFSIYGIVLLLIILAGRQNDIEYRKMLEAEAAHERAISAEEPIVETGLDLVLEQHLVYKDGNVSGYVLVSNHGPEVENLSSGSYPVNLGISLIDGRGRMLDMDLAHIAIKDGTMEEGESVEVPVELHDLKKYAEEGCSLRIAVVQENAAWVEDTSVYFQLREAG